MRATREGRGAVCTAISSGAWDQYGVQGYERNALTWNTASLKGSRAGERERGCRTGHHERERHALPPRV